MGAIAAKPTTHGNRNATINVEFGVENEDLILYDEDCQISTHQVLGNNLVNEETDTKF